MAPRGRTTKRLRRMDAAVDAMAPLGFNEQLVKKTVKNLLKEYGGDEWWPFIEEYSYKELIEAILRDQEEEQTQIQKGVSSQDEGAEDSALESTIRVSGTLVDSTCNEAGNTVGETDFSDPVNAVGEPTDKELCSNKQDIGSSVEFCPPPAEGGRNRWKDIGEDQPFIQNQKGMANAACSDGGNSVNQAQPGRSNSHVTTPPSTSSPCPVHRLKMCSGSQVLQSRSSSHVSTPPPNFSCTVVNYLPPPADYCPTTLPSSKPVSTQPPGRRFPCYGWIESDDEEDADDFILLQPMKPSTPLQSQNSSGGTTYCMKRKSRWDI